jgi:hypothetical protein
MALLLSIRLQAEEITVFDGMKVEVRLQNADAEPWSVPSPEDDSAAITIAVLSPTGELQRRINGITSQTMENTARVDTTPLMASIKPLETWEWTIDAARAHYPLPEGDHVIVLELFVPAHPGKLLRSNPVPVRVVTARLTAMHVRRDNPVIHRTDALLKFQSDGREVCSLRQWNPFRPLAAAYLERIPTVQGSSDIHTAAANFFQTESFEPLGQCWVVWRKDEEIQAAKLAKGQPAGGARRATLPRDRRLAGNSFYTFDDRLFIWLLSPEGDWELWELESRNLRPLMRHRVPLSLSPLCAVAADPQHIHMLIPDRGLVYEKLTYTGQIVEQRRLAASRLRPHSCHIEPDRGRAKALFWDGPQGKYCELICARLEPGTALIRNRVELHLRHPKAEFSFDFDMHGRYHLLVSTNRHRLYYLRGNRTPMLVAEGQERFFPLVVSPAGAYLGWHSRENGYRLMHYVSKAHAPRLQNFDLIG